jgi:hypothetical protein
MSTTTAPSAAGMPQPEAVRGILQVAPVEPGAAGWVPLGWSPRVHGGLAAPGCAERA